MFKHLNEKWNKIRAQVNKSDLTCIINRPNHLKIYVFIKDRQKIAVCAFIGAIDNGNQRGERQVPPWFPLILKNIKLKKAQLGNKVYEENKGT